MDSIVGWGQILVRVLNAGLRGQLAREHPASTYPALDNGSRTNQTTARGIMNTIQTSALIVAFLTIGSARVIAQPHEVIVHVEGTVFVDEMPVEPASLPVSLKENAVVRTLNGRTEIELAAGDRIFLGENGSVRMNGSRSVNLSRVEILTGSVVVISGRLGPSVDCETQVHLSDSGVFRFDVHRVVDERFCRVKVYKGAAAAPMTSFVWVLTSGESVDINRRCGDHTPRGDFNIEKIDDLDRWSSQRASARMVRP